MQVWQPQIKGVGEIQTLYQRREVGWQRLNISPVFPQVQCGFRTEIAYPTPGLSNGLWVELRDCGYKEHWSPPHPSQHTVAFWAVHLEVQPFHFFHFSLFLCSLVLSSPPSFLPILALLWKKNFKWSSAWHMFKKWWKQEQTIKGRLLYESTVRRYPEQADSETESSRGYRAEGKWVQGVLLMGYKATVWDGGKILEVVMMIAQHHDYA